MYVCLYVSWVALHCSQIYVSLLQDCMNSEDNRQRNLNHDIKRHEYECSNIYKELWLFMGSEIIEWSIIN